MKVGVHGRVPARPWARRAKRRRGGRIFCMSGRRACDARASPRILPSPVTTAAPVSSQLVSMPRTMSFEADAERSTGSPALTTSLQGRMSAKPRLTERPPVEGVRWFGGESVWMASLRN